jgi:uncharacterized membrane protein YfcA
MLSVPLMATLAGIGFVGSFVSGLVGVGGAIVMIPLLLYVPPLLGVGSLDVKAVAGVTMAQVLAATAIGAWTHGRHAAVHRGLALTGGPAMALGSFAGAIGSRYVSGRVLLAVFALMTTLALPLMLVPAGRIGVGAPPGVDWTLDRAQAIAYPAVIGLMSGLVGAGGAFLLLPVLIGVMGVPVRVGIGTSLAITTMSASMGFLGKLLTGQVLFWPSAAVVMGSLPGAPLGALVSRRAPLGLLQGVLAALVTATAVRVWIDVLFY